MQRKIHNENLRRRRSRQQRTSLSVVRSTRTRLVVFRSARHIYAQLVDPESGRTIASVSTRDRSVVGEGYSGNVEAAKKVGKAMAGLAREHQVEDVVFNRNGFLYHGRVKALADAAREEGLRF